METNPKLAFTESNFVALVDLVRDLKGKLSAVLSENKKIKEEVQAFKSQLNIDSHNSSKPPSSDGLKKKNVNLRKHSGKSPGGQTGHKGSTLKIEGNPDRVVYHIPFTTCDCGNEYLETEERVSHEIDLPIIKKEVTAHNQIHYHCTKCGTTFQEKVSRDIMSSMSSILKV